MVDDHTCDHLISWSPDGNSFRVHDPVTFAKEVCVRVRIQLCVRVVILILLVQSVRLCACVTWRVSGECVVWVWYFCMGMCGQAWAIS